MTLWMMKKILFCVASANISDYGSYENDSDDDNDFNYCGDSDNSDDEISSGGGEDMEEDNSDEPSNYLTNCFFL